MTTRRRMPANERREQLIGVARSIVASEGADALTLGHLAEEAGVSKPVVYDHFASRSGVLVALHQDFDRRQTTTLISALENAPTMIRSQVETIAECHVACALHYGAELGGVAAALIGSPELAKIKRDSDLSYVEICRRAISSSEGAAVLDDASAFAFLGAADALSNAALEGSISAPQAKATLVTLLITLTGNDRPQEAV